MWWVYVISDKWLKDKMQSLASFAFKKMKMNKNLNFNRTPHNKKKYQAWKLNKDEESFVFQFICVKFTTYINLFGQTC